MLKMKVKVTAKVARGITRSQIRMKAASQGHS